LEDNVETSQSIREHKTISQQERFKQVVEQTLEEQKLTKLKAILAAKMEPSSREKFDA
jgi:hypothetical protein